jgi:ComF family protein
MSLKKLLSLPINLLLPPRCGGCRVVVERDNVLCPKCWADLNRLGQNICACCGIPFAAPMPVDTLCGKCLAKPPAFDRARAVFDYDGTGRDLVLALKHADRGHLARMIGGWMAPIVLDLARDQPIWLLPVPLHWSRLWQRQYNQSMLLAQSIQRHLNSDKKIDLIDDLLIRHRATAPQGSPGAKDRAQNVKNAFQLHRPERLNNQHLILVDDVMTTGSTVNEIAQLLHRHGASRIDVISAARVGQD